jgi:hypothetical protein
MHGDERYHGGACVSVGWGYPANSSATESRKKGATLLQYGNTHENFGGFGALPVAPVSEAEGRVTDLWVGAQLPKHAHHPTHTPFEQLAVHYDASASAFCMLFKLTVRRWHSLRFRWVPDCQCPECSNRRRGHCKTLAVPVLGTYEN